MNKSKEKSRLKKYANLQSLRSIIQPTKLKTVQIVFDEAAQHDLQPV